MPEPNVVVFPPPSEYAEAVDFPRPELERLNDPLLRELVNFVDAPCFAALLDDDDDDDDDPPLPELDEWPLDEE